MYLYFPFFLFSLVPAGVAQKYRYVPGVVTDDILNCLLVINRKLSFLECHVTGVTKRRINTMFWTRNATLLKFYNLLFLCFFLIVG